MGYAISGGPYTHATFSGATLAAFIEGLTAALLPLTRGFKALVSNEDYVQLSQYKWHVHIHPGGRKYACRKVRLQGRKSFRVWMHREFAGTPSGFVTDHRDGNGLNNQRENLRTATISQNGQNRGPQMVRDKQSKYKGVCLRRDGKRWQAQIKAGKYICDRRESRQSI